MKITVKLYASLSKFLPSTANGHSAELEIDPLATPEDIILQLGIPFNTAHLVLINGIFIEPENRNKPILKSEDTLAIWPPIAGG